jgi:methanogenic corrinoid protein MtbC1
MSEPLLIRYLQPLLAGRRSECFQLVHDALDRGWPAGQLVQDVVWPAMAQVDRLYRDDRINAAIENMASRINRTVADQLQAHLPKQPSNGRRVLIACAAEFGEELGAQMVADLFQADGWQVYFVGTGVPHDELLGMVGELRPNVLVIFGATPQAVPGVRGLIDLIRSIGVCPTMNILLSGGVFDRADGLWREIGGDAYADAAADVLRLANELPPREPNAPRLGIVKKRRRRRAKPAEARPLVNAGVMGQA